MGTIYDEVREVYESAKAQLESIQTTDALEEFRIQFLGSKGKIPGLMSHIRSLSKEEKPKYGDRVNAVKSEITAAFDAKKAGLGTLAAGTMVDVTEPGKPLKLGNRHVLMKTIDELVELFGRMGFTVASGPEVEDDFHNFVALNIPASHPARDPLDNFYLEGGQHLLRTQTSTVQIRVMQSQPPPIRVVIPGRVYRPDTVDDTHLFMFHQLEALVIDQGVTMVDLKSTVIQFIKAYFGAEMKVRFRPSFFPFTEPSAEVDVWFEDKSKWIELGGCGMVHPNVLTTCGIDPEIYSGWAFGFGVERIAMRKYSINNIRLFVENDVRFLRQF